VNLPPVIFIFFNRPEVTRRTFREIRAQRPRRLYLIADGPRANKPGEDALCHETRALVESLLDWDCEVTRDYADTNLGCGRRVSSGLTSAFALLGEAIVLEDDVLPRPEFFQFCGRLLEQFRHEPRIHAINGFNPLGRYAPRHGSFTPSVFNPIWGWASWQRSWQDYRFKFDAWRDSAVQERVRKHVSSDLINQYFARSFDHMLEGNLDTWDFQWTFTMLERKRVSLVSAVNLIENIGFASDATHTTHAEPYFSGLKTHQVVATSRERSIDRPDRTHDELYANVVMSPSSAKIRLIRLVARSPLLQRLLVRRRSAT